MAKILPLKITINSSSSFFYNHSFAVLQGLVYIGRKAQTKIYPKDCDKMQIQKSLSYPKACDKMQIRKKP